MYRDEFASGASAARNKLAARLRSEGMSVRTSRVGCPPSDDDFVAAILGPSLKTGDESGSFLVSYVWPHKWEGNYHFRLPSALIESLRQDAARKHVLFVFQSHWRGGIHTLYLAKDQEGQLRVHHLKDWNGDVEILDTKIERLPD